MDQVEGEHKANRQSSGTLARCWRRQMARRVSSLREAPKDLRRSRTSRGYIVPEALCISRLALAFGFGIQQTWPHPRQQLDFTSSDPIGSVLELLDLGSGAGPIVLAAPHPVR